ncbi:hypothetical protein AVL48_15460 [Amycolatopsis regifaucium]|uniref:Uncharacterized protein n=1 Tax=Amycolatopsis regifaucium TaxID=546365 RepID=A0A154M573_9PSEU|nr:hypothetical protein AVL48_15460 [Amycolatopsis regifaucium]OKA09900.1 hypothetical protein ATP06_0205955 [Amycolatopsis regifaucium]SFI70408.1 hypothetical protein SAMN04489731_112197 [Amycolatopsis regifaucium]
MPITANTPEPAASIVSGRLVGSVTRQELHPAEGGQGELDVHKHPGFQDGADECDQQNRHRHQGG